MFIEAELWSGVNSYRPTESSKGGQQNNSDNEDNGNDNTNNNINKN